MADKIKSFLSKNEKKNWLIPLKILFLLALVTVVFSGRIGMKIERKVLRLEKKDSLISSPVSISINASINSAMATTSTTATTPTTAITTGTTATTCQVPGQCSTPTTGGTTCWSNNCLDPTPTTPTTPTTCGTTCGTTYWSGDWPTNWPANAPPVIEEIKIE